MRAKSRTIRDLIHRQTVGAWLLSLGLVLAWTGSAHAGAARPVAGGRYLLQLEGVDVGFVRSIEGGSAVAEAVLETAAPGAAGQVKKHAGNPRYEDLVIEMGFDLETPVYQWVADMLEGKAVRKSGAIITTDYDFKAIDKLTFKNALISRVTFSSFDATEAKAPATLTLHLAVEQTRNEATGDARVSGAAAKAKAAMSGAFRFELDGVDTKTVLKVEEFSASFQIAAPAVGTERIEAKEPTRLTLSNLTLSVSESGSTGFRDWHKSFVVDGKNDDGSEKSGAIVMLSPDLVKELGRVSFSNLGILRASSNKREPGAERVGSMRVELYTERMRLAMPGVVTAAPKMSRPAPAKKL